eukprot:jgi/Botrbrau1/8452/Bobra.0237s0069.1
MVCIATCVWYALAFACGAPCCGTNSEYVCEVISYESFGDHSRVFRRSRLWISGICGWQSYQHESVCVRGISMAFVYAWMYRCIEYPCVHGVHLYMIFVYVRGLQCMGVN